MRRPASTGERFAPRELPTSDAITFVTQSMSARPHRYEARVLLHVSAGQARGRVPSWWGEIEPLGEHSCEYRTGDDDLQWLAVRISMLAGFEFEVDGPPELLEQLREMGRRIERGSCGPRSPARR